MPQDQRATADQTAADGAAAGEVATRASDRERDAVVQRVQDAFAEGRLNDDEFDERRRAALTARTHADLDALLADLPAAPRAQRYGQESHVECGTGVTEARLPANATPPVDKSRHARVLKIKPDKLKKI